MIYRCRALKPKPSDWENVEADSPYDAAGEFQMLFELNIQHANLRVEQGNGHYYIRYVLVEVEGFGQLVSRFYHHGIWRTGGVKPPEAYMTMDQRLKKVAEAIGWERDPKELVEEGWECEETVEQAEAR